MKRQPKKVVSTGKTTCLLKFGYTYFACKSATDAAKAAEVLRKLQPVESEYDASGVYYVPRRSDRAKADISIEIDVPFEEQKRCEALPAPRDGDVPCAHCQATVQPGGVCPGCGTTAPL